MRKVREELFPANAPTRVLRVVDEPASPDFLVEIGAIAVVE